LALGIGLGLGVLYLWQTTPPPRSSSPVPATIPNLQERVYQLPRQLDLSGFRVAVVPPFVIVSDVDVGRMQQLVGQTLIPTIQALGSMYFEQQPKNIIEIWLFNGSKSYQGHCRQFFGIRPDTPFGFYSEKEHAIIMDLATGTGTLIHELVHVFMQQNFPKAPAWFGEGLASLYEQCQQQEGKIQGLPNWRLPELQQAIRGQKTVSLRQLIHLDDTTFFGSDRGLYYAQARYLCLYLQEQGLLVDFYRAFLADLDPDPSGWASLLKTLQTQESEIEAFEARWKDFVLGLTFRE
jgi:hypothetical protein